MEHLDQFDEWYEEVATHRTYRHCHCHHRSLLCLTQVEANIDLKDRRRRFLKDVFKKTRMSGTSATTPGNNRLHREFKVKGMKERLLRSKATT